MVLHTRCQVFNSQYWLRNDRAWDAPPTVFRTGNELLTKKPGPVVTSGFRRNRLIIAQKRIKFQFN
jgi:hypothetical protein